MAAQTINHIWCASLALSGSGADAMLPAAVWFVFVLGVLSGLTLGLLVSRVKGLVDMSDADIEALLDARNEEDPPREPWEQDADAWKRGQHDH